MTEFKLVPEDQALLDAGKILYGTALVRPGTPLYLIGQSGIEAAVVRAGGYAGRAVCVEGQVGTHFLGEDITADPENAALLGRLRQAERIAHAQDLIRKAEAFSFSIPELPPTSGARWA